MASILLKRGREKSLLRHHPWIFSGAVKGVDGSPRPGETVDVLSWEGNWLARGSYSPQSQIVVRVWSFNHGEEISPAFFRKRLETGILARRSVLSPDLTARRLIHAESDGLPGIIVDCYGDFLVCQFLTAGAEYWRGEIVAGLLDLTSCRGIYERSDPEVRQKEGLLPRAGPLAGEAPPDLVEIAEGPVHFLVDIKKGHKTGFYLDQRENRTIASRYSRDKEVLNAFSYSGGFGIWALYGGGSYLVNIDSSERALALARENVRLNRFDHKPVEFVAADVFKELRRLYDSERRFDLVVLDPPRFAESRGRVERAARGYKDINRLAFKLLRPGGLLLTFSCSGRIKPELFQKIIADAALDAEREGRILETLSQPADHPVALAFPEGRYLKGLLVRVN